MERFHERSEQAARREPDRAASELLESGNRWNPLIDAISTYVNGAELDRVSVYDTHAYEDTEVNWRLRRGYGALIAAYGAPVPVVTHAAVSLIDHSGPTIRIETARGTVHAMHVIMTVPTSVIADEDIRFYPPLPDKVEAASRLPLGLANKVMLALQDDSDLPAEGHLFGGTDRVGIGSYHLRPFGLPCIGGFFGGRAARALEEAGPGAIAAQAIDEIAALLGTNIRRKLKPLTESRWASDPFARGSYSHALPGHSGARAALAAPVDGRIFFGGEATSPRFFSTAHGARDSGERAAREILALRRMP
jgi:monoamine oxidase